MRPSLTLEARPVPDPAGRGPRAPCRLQQHRRRARDPPRAAAAPRLPERGGAGGARRVCVVPGTATASRGSARARAGPRRSRRSSSPCSSARGTLCCSTSSWPCSCRSCRRPSPPPPRASRTSRSPSCSPSLPPPSKWLKLAGDDEKHDAAPDGAPGPPGPPGAGPPGSPLSMRRGGGGSFAGGLGSPMAATPQ